MFCLHAASYPLDQFAFVVTAGQSNRGVESCDQQIDRLCIHLPGVGTCGHTAPGVNDDERMCRVNATRREEIEDIFPGATWYAQHQVRLGSRKANRAHKVQPALDFMHHALWMFVACC